MPVSPVSPRDERPPGTPDGAAAEPPPRVPVAIERAFAALAMAAICLITLGNVVVRYLTDYSFAFTEEYSVYLLVVLTLFGTAGAFAVNRHIRMTALVDLLPPAPRRGVELLALALSLLLFGLLAWYGAVMAWDDYRFEVTSPGLGMPQWLYTSALPLLSGLVMLRILGRAVRVWRSRRGG